MFRFLKKGVREEEAIAKEFVVVDTELTGLDERTDSIISIGAILMKEKSIMMGEIFYRVLNPGCKPKDDTILVHKLTPAEIEGCPDIKNILKEFLAFLKNRIIVGHYIDIDLRFLKKEVRKWLKIDFNPRSIDTYIIFNWLIERGLIPGKYKNAKTLADIADIFNIEVGLIHDALYDAFITAQIFQREIAIIQSISQSWFDLVKKIGEPGLHRYKSYQAQYYI